MPGVGSLPFGSSSYGLGVTVAPVVGGSLLRDPNTGQSRSARAIDPSTRDYVVDANGRIVGMDEIEQAVQIAVSTTKGSSAMRSLGQALASIATISDTFAREVDDTLRNAVQHLVDRQLIVVSNTTAQVVRQGVALVRLRWRNVATGVERITPVGN